MDRSVLLNVRLSCHISQGMEMGLLIQHDSECRDWVITECYMDLFQFQKVQRNTSVLGRMARMHRGVAHDGYEFGVNGFPSALGGFGCA